MEESDPRLVIICDVQGFYDGFLLIDDSYHSYCEVDVVCRGAGKAYHVFFAACLRDGLAMH